LDLVLNNVQNEIKISVGIGDWGLGIPNPQSPIPNPQILFL